MLYGQNLPWRLALRTTTRSSVRISCGTTHRLYSTARRSQTSAVVTSSLRPFLTPHATATRTCFSTSSARRKDTPKLPSEAEEEVTEDNAKDKTEKPTELSGDAGLESKKSSSESPGGKPTSGSAVDGKGSSAPAGSTGDSGSGESGKKGRKPSTALQKPTVPDVYPQVLAIPLVKRPLFPGFYKAVTIRDPNVVSAIQDMIKRGQPYVGAFLFKDENADGDVIEKMDDVHDVGVFAQITSAFPVHGDDGALTCVLYPHRRIKMSSLMAPDWTAAPEIKSDGLTPAETPIPEIIPPKVSKDEAGSEKKGDVVASFEETVVEKKSSEPSPYDPTSFLKKYKVSMRC